MKLRAAIFLHYMEQVKDPEFGGYLMRSNGLFAKVMADYQAGLQLKRVMETDAGQEALDTTKRLYEKRHE